MVGKKETEHTYGSDDDEGRGRGSLEQGQASEIACRHVDTSVCMHVAKVTLHTLEAKGIENGVTKLL